jgi:hypothetical protein
MRLGDAWSKPVPLVRAEVPDHEPADAHFQFRSVLPDDVPPEQEPTFRVPQEPDEGISTRAEGERLGIAPSGTACPMGVRVATSQSCSPTTASAVSAGRPAASIAPSGLSATGDPDGTLVRAVAGRVDPTVHKETPPGPARAAVLPSVVNAAV